jgi:hypothetical protein
VSKFDAGRAMTAEGCPEPEHHPACLEEDDLLVRLLGAAPAQSLIEGAGPGEVSHTERDEADSLLHGSLRLRRQNGRRQLRAQFLEHALEDAGERREGVNQVLERVDGHLELERQAEFG